MKKLIAIQVILWVLAVAGWGQCVYKACTCNWEPVGKAEILYTVGIFTGTGAIIGWFDIEDK